MNPDINMTSIWITNLIGLVAIFVTLSGNAWQLKFTRRENRLLSGMVILSVLACVADPLCFLCDGRPGLLSRIIVIGCNELLYVITLIMGCTWLLFLCDHLSVTLHRGHLLTLRLLTALGLAVLAVNLFVPVVFTVDEANVYSRLPLFWVYTALQLLFLADGILVYLVTRRKGGLLKFFPIWVYLVPVLAGTLIQSVLYGVSTIWPFTALSVCGVMSSMQNEKTFRDGLTGLYNRFYLDVLAMKSRKNQQGTAVMLDLDHFKDINDRYGHSVGDDALVSTAGILRAAASNTGEVIRYAGDEFILLLNTRRDEEIREILRRIREGFDRFNAESGKPYLLCASMGYDRFDLRMQRPDQLFDTIDKRMYEDKVRRKEKEI